MRLWGQLVSVALGIAVPAGATPGEDLRGPAGLSMTYGDGSTANRRLPMRVTGRVDRIATTTGPLYLRQWPGTYFDVAFRGTAVSIRIGAGEAAYRLWLDALPPVTLTKPRPGSYRLAGAAPGPHRLRVQVISESQAGATQFGGFFAEAGVAAAPLHVAARQIEFIGDSHTVGYGNTSTSSTCTTDQVWSTTDTAQGPAGQAARRFGADYQVNAISGRGVVRNYDGTAGLTIPAAYPFALLNGGARYDNPSWRPQVIVVALGTNDFSTPLHPGERWRDREALRDEYRATYLSFLRQLRARTPHALMIVWATDLAGGEIASQAEKVVDAARSAGDRRITFVPVHGLAFSGCHGHPSVADDGMIADAIGKAVDAWLGVWQR